MPETNNNVPVHVRVNTDFAEAACVVCIFVTIWLCTGDPDLLDALASFLLRG